MLEPKVFLKGKDVAAAVSMSESWIRQERWKRKHGLPHVFTVDPILIGSSPRYLASEVEAWIEKLAA